MSDIDELASVLPSRAPRRARHPFWTVRKVRAVKWAAVVALMLLHVVAYFCIFHREAVKEWLGIAPLIVIQE